MYAGLYFSVSEGFFSQRVNRRGIEKVLANARCFYYISIAYAGIAQLVERNLAKVDVAGSSPVSRSVPTPQRGKGTSGNLSSNKITRLTSSMNLPRCPKFPPGNGVFIRG